MFTGYGTAADVTQAAFLSKGKETLNAAGDTTLVKFHRKPKLGVLSLSWVEAHLIGGHDVDFHRRDLDDAIESGAYRSGSWTSRSSRIPRRKAFADIGLLDPTKFVPEERAPVQRIGKLALNRCSVSTGESAAIGTESPTIARSKRHVTEISSAVAAQYRRSCSTTGGAPVM